MNKELKKLFTTFNSAEPSGNLMSRIMARIDAKERAMATRRLIFFGISLLASIVSLVPAFQFLSASVTESGIGTFFSLIFSDLGNMLSLINQFGLSLLEAIPVTGIAVFLTVTLAFLWTLKQVVKNYYILNHHQTI